MAKVAKKARITREAAVIFGLGAGITEEDAEITGCRLPTNKQVIRCYMFHKLEGSSQGTKSNRTKRDNAKSVLEKVIPFYLKGNIPMVSAKRGCEKIIELFEKNAKLREIPVDRRSSPKVLAKLNEMEIELQKTFPLWAKDAEQAMKNSEDIKFLHSMKTDRIASFGVFHQALASQVKRKQTRLLKQTKRQEKAEKEKEVCETTVQLADSDSSQDEDDNSDNFVIPSQRKSHRRAVRLGTSAFIPHDILKSPKLVSLATRIKLSPAEQAAYTQAIVEECSGNQNKVAVSYATADRSRRQVGEKIAAGIREEWTPPTYASLHWDSKLMGTLSNKNVNEERLTVAIGDVTQIKLLGVPAYRSGTNRRSGEIITEKTMELLKIWNCQQSVVSMVFDTTASNTGHVTAACVNIQQALGRPLIWAACRHHVGEVILAQVFTDLKIEVSKSPEVSVFSRFKKQFESVPHTSKEILSLFDSGSYFNETKTLVMKWRNEAINHAISSAEHQRDDYKEFSELCLLYLNHFDGDFKFKRPGAMHKARWMAKLLYSTKIVLLESQIGSLPPGSIATKSQIVKLREFVTFACLIYSPWWNTCATASDAPWNDLSLFKKCLHYKTVNLTVSQSAITALSRHLWYLTAEIIPLALFSDITPSDERRRLADKLLSVKSECQDTHDIPSNRFGTGFGKPRFPIAITHSTTLADLATHDSWFLFSLLNLDTDFLTKEVEDWKMLSSYCNSKTKIGAINVINDCSERGVKLSSDFSGAAKTEDHFQNVLQVVELDRKKRPNLRKPK